jgi:hypothetical protein
LACAGVAERDRSGPVGDWGAREPKTGMRGVDGKGIAGGHTEGTKTSEKVRSIAGVRDGESSSGVVVGDRNLEAMGWAYLVWYKVERRETRKSKSERREYLTPKSSTSKTKRIE